MEESNSGAVSNLEDKVNFAEGSNVKYEAVRPPLLYEYKRKKGKKQSEKVVMEGEAEDHASSRT